MKGYQHYSIKFFCLLISLLILSLGYAVAQSQVHLQALSQFFQWIINPTINYEPLDLTGLPQAIAGTILIMFLGGMFINTFLGRLNRDIETIALSLAAGYGLIGCFTLILSYLRLLYLYHLLTALAVVSIILLFVNFRERRIRNLNECLVLLKNFASAFYITRTKMSKEEWLLIFTITLLWIGAFYHAIAFPPLEFDSVIYHAPMAKIMYDNYGLPLIVGGGVGIGSSANYPLLFSAIGTYYYLIAGSANDLFLRIVTPLMGLLSVIATYLIAKMIGGRRLGLLATFVFTVVPAYLSYSSFTTQETTVTCFLAYGVLLLLKAIHERGSESAYWSLSGTFFGFSLLTTYQALFFIPALLTVILYHIWKKRVFNDASWKTPVILIGSMIAVGCVPYVRNLLVLGNPVYPFFSSLFKTKYLPSWLFTYTKRSWDFVANSIATGKPQPTEIELLVAALLYPSHFPLNILLILPSTLIFLASPVKAKHTILSFTFIPLILIFLNKPSFIRYVWLTFPYASVIVGFMFLKGFEASENLRFSKGAKIVLVTLISFLLIFPLPVAIAGHAYCFVAPFWPKPGQFHDYLTYTVNPGHRVDLLPKYYGSDAYAWQWLNENLRNGERVAGFETRIYHVKDANYRIWLFLDSLEAEPLYLLDDPNEILSFLSKKNVKYVFVRATEEQVELFRMLPLTKFLGSPTFPIIFQKGSSVIYKVGSLQADEVIQNPKLAYLGPNGLRDLIVSGAKAKAVITGNASPRLYVDARRPTIIRVTYFDLGEGSLSINLYNPHTRTWIYDYATIVKKNTDEWRTYEFLAPVSESGFVEFGLYAHREDFVIGRIEASPLQLLGKISIYSLMAEEFTNMTEPPTLMVYLPILSGNEKIEIQTNSHGKKISVEIFEGVIQPWETTKWWERHRMVARVPELPIWGIQNPTLIWKAEPGVYTLAAVLWDEFSPDAKVDLSITIGGSR